VGGERLRWRPFALPLRSAFRSALPGVAGELRVREGLLLAIDDGEGSTGWGEAMPLPLPGAPTANELAALLDEDAPVLAEPERTPPALRCGLEAALLDLEGQRCGLPIAALLAAGAQPMAVVEVNAVIDADAVEPAAVAAAGRVAVADGFATLKLKVGVEGLAVDLARVRALREACPGTRIRLDANGAWAEPIARLALERLTPLEIELVEQPLAAGEVTALARLRERSSIPLAADEALAEPGMAERLIDAGAVDALVLKPAVLGGVRAAAALAARAREAGMGAFVTTTVDSSLGTALALQLAAGLNGTAEGTQLAHGLATGLALERDLVAAPLLPERGRMALPDAPGLGIAPDEAAIERAATGPWSAPRALGAHPTLGAVTAPSVG